MARRAGRPRSSPVPEEFFDFKVEDLIIESDHDSDLYWDRVVITHKPTGIVVEGVNKDEYSHAKFIAKRRALRELQIRVEARNVEQKRLAEERGEVA